MVPLIAAGANVVVCVLVLRLGMRDRLQRAFGALTLVSASWNLGIFSLCFFTDPVSAEWWSRIFRTGICLAPAVVFHFGLVLSQASGALWRALQLAAWATGATLAIANLAGALVSGVEPHRWGWWPVPTRLYSALTTSLVVFMLLWFERAWRTYRSSTSARQRVQAKFWLLGAIIQTPFVMTNLLPLYGVQAYPLGNVGNVIFVSIVAYAMVRHRLMDVDFVVRKGVSFCAASAVVLIPGALGMAALTRATGASEPLVLVCAALALALVAVVVIPTLQEALETQVHRALFPRVYDYRLRLRQLAAALVHVLDQGELVRRLGDGLVDILDVEQCEIYLREQESGRLALAYPSGAAPLEGIPGELLGVLESLAEPTLISELGTIDGVQRLGWEVVIPLGIKEHLHGFVALGPNRYLRIFSSEDLELLATVAADASVALQNASLSRQLRRSEIVLERANQLSSLGMLAAGIAHEIRNPLVAVKTFLDLLPQRLDDPAFLDHFRELSLSELRRVTDLIADLLALGKSKTPERRAVEVAAVLEPVVRLMESTARKRQVALQVRFQASLPAVWADPDQLKQIILNLLLNAIEVSPAGSTVGLQVHLAGRDNVVLEVRDEGPGIPLEQREAIFHPFFTTKDTGAGLGLALVHQMVVEHGGEITVESEVGLGTMFRVTLPTARVNLARTGT